MISKMFEFSGRLGLFGNGSVEFEGTVVRSETHFSVKYLRIILILD